MENNEDPKIITKLMMSLCDDIHTVATREKKKHTDSSRDRLIIDDLSLMTEEKTPGRVKT